MSIQKSDVFGIEVHKIKKFKSFISHNNSHSNDELLSQIEQLNSTKEDLNYSNRLLFEMYNSNKIEGNTLTRQDTKLVLEDKIIPEGLSYKDLIECINLRRAISNYRKIDTLNLDLILSIHKALMADLLDTPGIVRNEPVYISSCMHIPPSADKVENLLNKSIEKYNNSSRTIVDMFIFKLEFVSIHPFTDGNGRTSRLLLNALLENAGYPRLIFKDSDKKYYYKALEDAQVKYKIDSWIRYCLLLMKYNLEYLNSIDILE